MAEILLIHCGDNPPPASLGTLLNITRKIAPQSDITVLTNELHAQRVLGYGNFFKFLPIESIPRSTEHQRFAESSALNRDFRGGFWYHTTSRFFVLSDYMQQHQAEDVVHFENDVVPFFDPSERAEVFRNFADFAVPLDRNRAIASVVWLSHCKVATALSTYLLNVPASNDMEALNGFCSQHPGIAKPLPTMPRLYAQAKGLDPMRYCQGVDEFGGIFDAAAIGQYVGGVDRLNNPHDSRFFVNESSDLDLREFDFSWRIQRHTRTPIIRHEGVDTPVLCLHAHSKDLVGVSPYNLCVTSDNTDIITGERLQACADLTVSTPAITQFHGARNIQTPRVVEVAQNEQGQLLIPGNELIAECAQAKVIFVYTHLLTYFRLYIAPRLQQPFVLISHNSDHAVTLNDIDLLNHPQLVHWWAQNAEVSHTRLSPLPIGLANQQWGAQKIDQLLATAQNISKDKLLYANVGLTHPSRIHARNAAAKVEGATVEAGLDYPAYLASMARHKFCLCPRGNGIDSHRIWEALYLNCIPIIVKNDWISAYSEFPMLVLDSWEDLPQVKFAEQYIRLSTTAHRFDRLALAYYKGEFEKYTLRATHCETRIPLSEK